MFFALHKRPANVSLSPGCDIASHSMDEGEVRRMELKQPNRASNNPMIDFGKLRAAPLNEHPFRYLIGHNIIKPEWEDRLISDFPRLDKGGSFSLSTVKVGSDFRSLIEEMSSQEFREFVEETFSVSLSDRPTMFTVRGHCRLTDGKIHTDTESK